MCETINRIYAVLEQNFELTVSDQVTSPAATSTPCCIALALTHVTQAAGQRDVAEARVAGQIAGVTSSTKVDWRRKYVLYLLSVYRSGKRYLSQYVDRPIFLKG